MAKKKTRIAHAPRAPAASYAFSRENIMTGRSVRLLKKRGIWHQRHGSIASRHVQHGGVIAEKENNKRRRSRIAASCSEIGTLASIS